MFNNDLWLLKYNVIFKKANSFCIVLAPVEIFGHENWKQYRRAIVKTKDNLPYCLFPLPLNTK